MSLTLTITRYIFTGKNQSPVATGNGTGQCLRRDPKSNCPELGTENSSPIEDFPGFTVPADFEPSGCLFSRLTKVLFSPCYLLFCFSVLMYLWHMGFVYDVISSLTSSRSFLSSMHLFFSFTILLNVAIFSLYFVYKLRFVPYFTRAE